MPETTEPQETAAPSIKQYVMIGRRFEEGKLIERYCPLDASGELSPDVVAFKRAIKGSYTGAVLIFDDVDGKLLNRRWGESWSNKTDVTEWQAKDWSARLTHRNYLANKADVTDSVTRALAALKPAYKRLNRTERAAFLLRIADELNS